MTAALLFLVWVFALGARIDAGVSRFKAQQRRCRGTR